MKTERESTLSIPYIKPEMMDLGAAVIIHGAACETNGLNATGDCMPSGGAATQQCAEGGSAATYR